MLLPGDILPPFDPPNPNLKLGSGLSLSPTTQTIRATQPGELLLRPNACFVRCNKRRYIPKPNDNVVGIVEERFAGEFFRVNVFGTHPAILHYLDFEGATKRNRPNLQPGTVVYARVLSTDRDVDPVLSCKVEAGSGASRKDWMTDEGTYGVLKPKLGAVANVVRCSMGLTRGLLEPENAVLSEMGKRGMAFEVAVGVNGAVWVSAMRVEEVVLICNAVMNSEVMEEDKVRKMVKELMERMHRED